MFFCHRFFELRFLVATNILGELSKYGVVTLLLPKELATSYRTILKSNPNIKVAISRYDKSDFFLRTTWLNFWSDILYLTVPNTDKNPNATAKFHRQHYRSKSILKRALVVNISKFISHFSRFLPLIVWLYQVALPRGPHQVLLDKERPDLMIGCSFGLSLEEANNLIKEAVAQIRDKKADGGMPTGIMRLNQAGVKERDYREDGGFVPVGIKEKAACYSRRPNSDIIIKKMVAITIKRR